jgi:hypothetical protein
VERKGFAGSAIRALATSLFVLAQRSVAQVLGLIEDVTKWLPARHAQATGVQLTAEELTRVLTVRQDAAAPELLERGFDETRQTPCSHCVATHSSSARAGDFRG